MAVRQRLTILVPGAHQRRDQIVSGVFLAKLNLTGEICGHLVDRAHHGVVVLDAQFKNFVDPFYEEVAVLFRDA